MKRFLLCFLTLLLFVSALVSCDDASKDVDEGSEKNPAEEVCEHDWADATCVDIGATATRPRLLSRVVATILFFGIYHLFSNLMGNHALWLAFIIYLSARGGLLALYLPRLYPQ